MNDLYQINPECGIPIYQQIVDELTSRIKGGELPADTQLPTVRELADRMGIARGTIKKAYDELEHTGLVKKIQGRGTFVCYAAADGASRKERAMAAIDELLEKLESMDFSMSEIDIFLKLKLREREAHQSNVRVAVIECNPEVLSQLTEQLRQIEQIDIYSYLLDDVRAYPYKLTEEMDLIITTVEHAAEVETMTAQKRKIAKIVLRLEPKCVAKIVKLQAGRTLGILCHSERFGRLLETFCRTYAEGVTVMPPREFSPELDCAAYLRDKDAVLVPEDCRRYCGAEAFAGLQKFAEGHPVIPCAYQIDEGSFMYASEIIERLRDRKKLIP